MLTLKILLVNLCCYLLALPDRFDRWLHRKQLVLRRARHLAGPEAISFQEALAEAVRWHYDAVLVLHPGQEVEATFTHKPERPVCHGSVVQIDGSFARPLTRRAGKDRIYVRRWNHLVPAGTYIAPHVDNDGYEILPAA